MFCSNCGMKISESAKFCKYCGFPQELDEDCTQEKNIPTPPKDESFNKETHPVDTSPTSPSPPNSKIKNIIAMLLSVILVIGLITTLILVPILSKNKQENAFESTILSSDYSYTYDDSNNVTVISILIPKYDFIDFSFTIRYNCSGEYITEEHSFDKVEAGQKLKFVKSLKSLKEETGEDFYYSYINVNSGKKQNKFANSLEEVVYNTECSFYFSWSGLRHESTLSATITNTTQRNILELRDFFITINFDDEEGLNRRLRFYCPRLKFEEPLQPWETISISKLSGVSVKNWSADDWNASITYTKSRYSEQTYEVIYQ